MKRLARLFAAAAVLSGCSVPLMHYTGYRGDGIFTPHAAPTALCQDGYTLDLDAIDLNATSEVTHVLSGLPRINAVIGLAVERKDRVASTPHDEVFATRPAALIEVTLRDASERIVLSRRENLMQWIGSRIAGDPDHVFLFQRGTEAEIPVAPGQVRVEQFPIGTDDSWGTYFKPRRDERYTLHFAVVEPGAVGSAADATSHDIAVRLQVRGVTGCF